MKQATKDSGLRSDGKPRATAEQITAARRKAAEARWAGSERTAWRTIRVHDDTYATLDALRTRKGLSWDDLLSGLARRR